MPLRYVWCLLSTSFFGAAALWRWWGCANTRHFICLVHCCVVGAAAAAGWCVSLWTEGGSEPSTSVPPSDFVTRSMLCLVRLGGFCRALLLLPCVVVRSTTASRDSCCNLIWYCSLGLQYPSDTFFCFGRCTKKRYTRTENGISHFGLLGFWAVFSTVDWGKIHRYTVL